MQEATYLIVLAIFVLSAMRAERPDSLSDVFGYLVVAFCVLAATYSIFFQA